MATRSAASAARANRSLGRERRVTAAHSIGIPLTSPLLMVVAPFQASDGQPPFVTPCPIPSLHLQQLEPAKRNDLDPGHHHQGHADDRKGPVAFRARDATDIDPQQSGQQTQGQEDGGNDG